MGAVNFSLDIGLADVLKEGLKLKAFVETGTFQGDTVELLKDRFKRIYSIELSDEYYTAATARFSGLKHVHILQGDSSQVLKKVAADLREVPALYFLDAHWCVAENTAGVGSQCPLLAELESIGKLNASSVVVIDDARLFLAPPLAPHETSQWPTFSEILSRLQQMNGSHLIMVLNDNIVFYPESIHGIINDFGKKYGIDWLYALHTNRDYENLRHQFDGMQEELKAKDAHANDLLLQLKAKDKRAEVLTEQLRVKDERMYDLLDKSVLQGELEKKIADIQRICDERMQVIEEQAQAIHALRKARIISRLKADWIRRVESFKEKLRPRLGVLNQYPPKEISFSDYQCSRSVSLSEWPRISIVTPSFQQADFIEQTMKSVLDQGYPNLEYFVQDGASTDGTVDILKRYDDQLTGWQSKKDSGQSQAINRGMSQTNGDIMAWLNSDDLLMPGSLAYVASYFDTHPDVDVVYGHRLIIDERGCEIGRWVMPKYDHDILSWADYVPQETLFWRRSIWEKAGGQIDESFRFAMDWDLILRFRDAGAHFDRLPTFVGAFRVHPAQKTSAAIHEVGVKEMSILRERCHGRVVNDVEIREAVAPFMRKHLLAHYMLKYMKV